MKQLSELNYLLIDPPSESKSSSDTPTNQVSSDVHSIRGICHYEFKQEDPDNDQHPKSFVTAECTRKMCHRICSQITYDVTVLKRNKHCNGALGIQTWRLATKRIVIGYKLK